MKALVFFAFLFFSSIVSFAQIKVNDVDITPLKDVQYIRVIAGQVGLSAKLTVAVDYGQEFKLGTEMRISGPDGKPQKFNSVAAVLNFFANNGWELITSSPISEGGNSLFQFILKRKG